MKWPKSDLIDPDNPVLHLEPSGTCEGELCTSLSSFDDPLGAHQHLVEAQSGCGTRTWYVAPRRIEFWKIAVSEDESTITTEETSAILIVPVDLDERTLNQLLDTWETQHFPDSNLTTFGFNCEAHFGFRKHPLDSEDES